MSLNAATQPSAGGDKVPQPVLAPDQYPARLVSVVDLGLQPQKAWKGEAKPNIHKLNITYELLDEFLVDEDGNVRPDKPLWLSETMPFHNIKAERAKSTLRMKAIDPQGVANNEWAEMLGMPCLVATSNNESDGKTYTNISDVARPVKGMVFGELQNSTKLFELDNPNMDVFNDLPPWIRDTITTNLEYNGSKLQGIIGGEGAVSTAEPVAAPTPPPAPQAPA